MARSVRTRGARLARPRSLALLALAAALIALHLATAPPALPSPAEVRAAHAPSEAWLRDRDGAVIDSVRVDFDRRRLAWVPLADISPVTVETVIAAEDRRFWSHGGVDWIAMAGAARARLSGGHSGGASTIPMQLAAFLAPDLAVPGQRGWWHKLRQMRAAWALARRWDRASMIEAYLNLVPLRGEVQGIGAGADTLFGKRPAALTRDDALVFAALLPDPAASAPRIGRRACAIARRMETADTPADTPANTPANTPDCAALASAAGIMTGGGRRAAADPDLAPHLAHHLLDRAGVSVTSTLSAPVQRIAVHALRRQLLALGPGRARDGAVVVLDNESGDVLAYVGGVGLDSTAAAVDGARAFRQAGSTLKPHLYAQVIDAGWLTPASILDDSPVQLDTASGLYVPRNYDRSFKGPVTVRAALAQSLNVPAVRALVLGDVQSFRDRLWDLGYHGLTQDGSYYGFSLALGSAEVSLLEQANAYRTLANGGRSSPPRLTINAPRTAPRAVLSPAAAFITADMLADATARAAAFGPDSALRLPFWAAVKTGTSKGMRDNWCVGFSPRYTVAVWVGNLEGDAMRDVSGTSGAAPVWRDVMLALHRDAPPPAPAPPAGVERRTVTLAGTREGPRTEWFMAGTAQSDLAAVPATARRPRIINPVSGAVYARDPDIPVGRQALGISVAGGGAGHRLILDRRDIGAADDAPQLPLVPGTHRLALADAGGRVVDQVRFTVR